MPAADRAASVAHDFLRDEELRDREAILTLVAREVTVPR
jgi:hypothetical protein